MSNLTKNADSSQLPPPLTNEQILLKNLRNNNQLLINLCADPMVPADQKTLLKDRVHQNTVVIKVMEGRF